MPRSRQLAARRVLLLGSTSISILLSSQEALAGPDACALDGGIRICTGDQSDGVAETGVNRLAVHDLTKNIAPASGTGIRIDRQNGDVELNSDTGPFVIRTQGDGAVGVLASSVYGDATIVHSGDIETNGNRAAGIAAGSSDAYSFRRVSISVAEGTIRTLGDNSVGIAGSAGMYSVVSVSNQSDILTEGELSSGISARAGNSAFVSNHGDITTTGSGAAGIAAGSNYEAVGISNTGRISTSGDRASGIAGGGYNSITVTNSGDIETAGAQSSGISAGAFLYNARVLNSARVTTLGDNARGIQANSQYGGAQVETSESVTTGGVLSHAIVATSQYSTASVIANADISTSGDGAHGVFASSGRYGSTDIALTGRLSTEGVGSHGIDAYSYSGNMRISVSGDAAGIVTNGEDAIGIALRTGGFIYGAVDLDVTGDIETTGTNAAGVDILTNTDSAQIDLSGRIVTSGDLAPGIHMSGNYGGMTASILGTIETSGLQSHGIEFNSLYNGGSAITLADGASILTAGSGASAVRAVQTYGPFSLTSSGTILTSGDGADAVFVVQSGDAYAYGAPVTIRNSGTLSASGINASAVRITANVDASLTNSGTITGGRGYGAAIRSLGAGSFGLVNTGAISAESGLALEFAEGNDIVDNSGMITGDIVLGDGANRFSNRNGGVVEAAGLLNTGSDGVFENSGLVYVAGRNAIGETGFVGQFVQTADGAMVFDLDIAGATADLLSVSGRADVAGSVILNFVSAPPGEVASGMFDPIALITASDGLTSSGAGVDPAHLDVNDTVAYDFGLSADANTIWLEVLQVVNRFEPLLGGGSSANQSSAAAYLDRILENGDAAAAAPLINSLRMEADTASLLGQLDLLTSPSNTAILQISDRYAYKLLEEMPCLTHRGRWCASFSGAAGEGEGDIGEAGFSYETEGRQVLFEAGYGLSDTWSVSAAFSETEVDLSARWLAADGDGNATAARVGVHGGFGFGDVAMAAIWQKLDADLSRLPAQSGATALRSRPEVRSSGVMGRLSRTIELSSWKLEPSLSVSVICHEANAFTEQGNAVEALVVSGWDTCDPGLMPGAILNSPEELFRIGTVPIGIDFRASGQLLEADALRFDSYFLATGAAAGTFRSGYGFDNRFWALSGGVEAKPVEGMTLRFGADVHQGGSYEDWSAALSMRFAF